MTPLASGQVLPVEAAIALVSTGATATPGVSKIASLNEKLGQAKRMTKIRRFNPQYYQVRVCVCVCVSK